LIKHSEADRFEFANSVRKILAMSQKFFVAIGNVRRTDEIFQIKQGAPNKTLTKVALARILISSSKIARQFSAQLLGKRAKKLIGMDSEA
jgi:hypothetical protein